MKKKMAKSLIFGLLTVLLIITFLSLTAYGEVPQQINYQGYLEDSDGVPIDEIVDIVFSLYDVDTGGAALWTETQNVNVIGGIFNVILGGVNPIALDFDTQYYLGVKVGTDNEMIPRQSLTSVGYAMRADSVSDRGITSMMIDHDAIDTEHISDDAVDTDQIADDAISSDHFEDSAIITKIIEEDGTGSGLDADLFDGQDSSAFMPAGADNWVNEAGDTMTGTLNLATDGLVAGMDQLVISGGNVGIGTASPGSTLDVDGDINTSGVLMMDSTTILEVDSTLENIFLGDSAGKTNTTGYNNTFIGRRAGYSNTTGGLNTFIGYAAGENNTIGDENTFIGYEAGQAHTDGDYNTFLGYRAGYLNTTATSNTFIGYGAGPSNTIGKYNTYVGYLTGYSNTTGNSNVFIGYEAGFHETGSNKLYISNSSTSTPLIYGEFDNALVTINGDLNTSGELMMDGATVLEADSTSNSTFLGNDAGQANTEGAENTFIGESAGYSNTTGNYNAFLGYKAGYFNTEGAENTFIGNYAGQANIGNANVFLGFNAGFSETGSNKLYISNSPTSTPLIYGEFDNALVTINDDLSVTGNLGIGTTSPNEKLEVDGNIQLTAPGGNRYIKYPDSDSSLFIGEGSTGPYAVVLDSIDSIRFRINSGDKMVVRSSGYVGIGTTGPSTDLDVNGNARFRNIGSDTYSAPVNQTSDGTLTTSTSDRRLKTNIEDIEDGLNVIMALQGVRFNWKEDPEGEPMIGLIAQDAEEVIPELTYINPTDGYMGINYAEITAVLIEAVKEQQTQIETQQETISALTERLARLEKQSRKQPLMQPLLLSNE